MKAMLPYFYFRLGTVLSIAFALRSFIRPQMVCIIFYLIRIQHTSHSPLLHENITMLLGIVLSAKVCARHWCDRKIT